VFQRSKLTALSSGLEGTLTAVLCWAGLHLGGFYGAVAGCAVAALIAAMFSFALARTLFGYYLRWADLARIAVATAVMALAQMLMPQAGSLMRLMIEIAVCAGVYFAVMAVLYPALAQQAIDGARARLTRREV